MSRHNQLDEVRSIFEAYAEDRKITSYVVHTDGDTVSFLAALQTETGTVTYELAKAVLEPDGFYIEWR